MLSNFKIDTTRDLLAPDFKCYQMDLSGPVNAAIQAGEVDAEFKQLPSWAKFAANPIKAKGFFSRTLQAIFLGQGGHDELNSDVQTETYAREGVRVAMMFLPDNTGTMNGAIDMARDIASESLSGFHVMALAGSQDHNGRKMKNANVERAVKEQVEICKKEGKSLLILASKMAQRSFSIPEITELYLAYDNGQLGSTLQKMSRTLTPGGLDKVGNVFSLSFDPNRDDKFDAMVIETAINYKRRNSTPNILDALRSVLATVDIYKCTEDGAVQVDIDTYLEDAMERKGISRVLGKIVDFTEIPPATISALAQGDGDYFRQAQQDKAEKGRTRDKVAKAPNTKAKTDRQFEKELAKAREMITTILENLNIIIIGSRASDLTNAFEQIEGSNSLQQFIIDEFGVGYEVIQYLFDQGIIKQDWVDLMHKYD